MTLLDLFAAIGFLVTIVIVMSVIATAFMAWTLWRNDRAEKKPRDRN